MSYLDSCYIAKFYLAEPDSAQVIAFVQQQGGASCMNLGKTEVVAVFHRKFREGITDITGFQLLCDQFESDCSNGLWEWHPIDERILRRSSQHFRSLPASTFLRAADALHLTCAADAGFSDLYTSDRHIITSAAAFGLQAIKL